MKLTERQRRLLQGILADTEAAANAPCPIDKPETGWDLQLIDIWRREQSGIVRSDPTRWLNKALTSSDHVMNSRDWKRLEAAGLIQRHCFGFERIAKTHISLTGIGIKLARQLQQEVEPKVVVDG